MKVIACALSLLLAFGFPEISQQATPTQTPTTGTNAAVPQKAESAPASTDAASTPNTLLDGTPIKMRLGENLSSETNKTSDQVPFEVTDEVVVQGMVVVPKGAAALATVTFAEPKRRMGRGGKLDVTVESVRLGDGERAQLRAVKENKGGGHVGAMTGAIVATSIVFFPAAPFFLFMHGKSVEIPKGTEVTAFVQGDMHLDMAKFTKPVQPTAAPAPAAEGGTVSAAAPSAASVTQASLTIDSSVAGADIEVDGNFVGSTPSTLSVAPGQHTIVVKKKGYADWSRTMNVAGSGVRVNAELEAKP